MKKKLSYRRLLISLAIILVIIATACFLLSLSSSNEKIHTALEPFLKIKSGQISFNKVSEKFSALFNPALIVAQLEKVFNSFKFLKSWGEETVNFKFRKSFLLLFSIIFIIAKIFFFLIHAYERFKRRKLEKRYNYLLNENKNLSYLNERLNVALDNSEVPLWEFDLEKKRIIQNKSSKAAHGLEFVIKDVPESLIENGYVHSESADDFLKMYDKIYDGEKMVEGIFKMHSSDRRKYRYLKVKYTNLFDDEGKPYKAIGASEDVSKLYELNTTEEYWQSAIEDFSQNKTLYFQYNLTKNSLLNDSYDSENYQEFSEKNNYFVNNFVAEEDREKFLKYTNKERLLKNYKDGKTEDSLKFQMLVDNLKTWTVANTHLVKKTDSDEILLFVFIFDIDKEMKE